MSRLPPIPREDLSPSDQHAYDEIWSVVSTSFGDNVKLRRKDGGLIGPLPFFLASPDLGLRNMQYFASLAQLPDLSREARETAILVTGARFQAGYEMYAHESVAVNTTALTKVQAQQLCKGVKPEGLDEQCDVAFDVTKYLANTPGPLPQDLWNRAVSVLGKQGTISLVHYVGFYAYICIVINAMDAPLPEGDE